MKIGIITFHHAHNCGAALQVLALQTLLERMGHAVSVINYRVARIDRAYANTSAERQKRFEAFQQSRLHLSPLFRSLRELQEAPHPYDALIAGSDQIWNAGILGGLNAAYFCNFGAKDARRIIYGASIGGNELSSASRFLLQNFLQYPDFISVREPSMLPLLRPLTDKTLTVVSDPALLLDREFYDGLKAPLAPQSPYIYLHYVHPVGENPALDTAAGELSALTGLPVCKNRSGIRFAHELADCSEDGPQEFLSRIASARYVVTDSFHATVFSILFAKHFLTVPPVKRPDRLLELLHTLSLQDHCYMPSFDFQSFLRLSAYEFTITTTLQRQRSDSLHYLEHALRSEVTHAQDTYPQKHNPFLCVGCALCRETTGEGSNHLQPDAEGFLYPRGNKRTCLYQEHSLQTSSPVKPSHYLAWHRNLYERMMSFEAGLLPEFFRRVLADHGAVIARSYDATDGQMHYRLATTESDLLPFLSFCPQEANPSELFRLIRSFRSQSTAPLLIFTIPCHLSAVRRLFSPKEQNLLLLELRCDGVVSPLASGYFLNRITERCNQKVLAYNLAAKHFTDSRLRIEYLLQDNRLFCEYRSGSPFYKAYRACTLQRPSCYHCTLRTAFPGVGDLLIAPLYNVRSLKVAPEDNILSYLCCFTQQGTDFFRSCSDHFHCQEYSSSKTAALFPTSLQRFPLTVERPNFYQNLSAKK